MLRGVLLFTLFTLFALPPGPGLAQAPAVTELDPAVFEIGRQLRCPACISESVADSSAQIAVRMRQEIQEMLAAGRSEREIIDHFQGIYGDFILLEPPRRGLLLWVWLLPVAALVLGGAALAVYLGRWTRAAAATPSLSAEELNRVREALAEAEGGPRGPG